MVMPAPSPLLIAAAAAAALTMKRPMAVLGRPQSRHRSEPLEAPVSGRCLSPPSSAAAAGPPARGAVHGGKHPEHYEAAEVMQLTQRRAASVRRARRGQSPALSGFSPHRFAIFLSSSSSLCVSPPAHAHTSSPVCCCSFCRLLCASSHINASDTSR